MRKYIYDYFKLNDHNTNIRTEFFAGVTNYFTLLYIVTLVPEILMDIFPGALDSDGRLITDAVVFNNMTAGQLIVSLTAAALISSGIASIFLGVFVNVPFIQGPSLTISTFIVYTVCKNFGYTYPQALGVVFISGIIFFIFAVTGIEKRLHQMIPDNIKYAVSGGIGMFIVYQGLLKAHILEKNSKGVLFMNILNISSNHWKTAVLTIIGVIFIIILIKRHVHGAIFIGKITCIIAAIPLGLTGPVYMDNSISISPLLFSADVKGLFNNTTIKTITLSLLSIIIIVFTICIMDIFETISMTLAMKNFLKKNPEEKIRGNEFPKMLEVDSVTTSVGALLGMTSISTYVESTAGLVEGARTGLTSVITGILFILTVAFTPFSTTVPSSATATTLIMAGVMMIGILKYIDFEDVSEAIPAVLTILIMIILNKIIVGIAVGLISYVLCNVFLFKKKINLYLFFMSIFMLIVLIFTTQA